MKSKSFSTFCMHRQLPVPDWKRLWKLFLFIFYGFHFLRGSPQIAAFTILCGFTFSFVKLRLIFYQQNCWWKYTFPEAWYLSHPITTFVKNYLSTIFQNFLECTVKLHTLIKRKSNVKDCRPFSRFNLILLHIMSCCHHNSWTKIGCKIACSKFSKLYTKMLNVSCSL